MTTQIDELQTIGGKYNLGQVWMPLLKYCQILLVQVLQKQKQLYIDFILVWQCA